jgi:threonine synthase
LENTAAEISSHWKFRSDLAESESELNAGGARRRVRGFMNYISTRGQTPAMNFQDAVMTGLAPDGGLLIPESIPDVRDRLAAWSQLDYKSLAFEILRLFTDLSDAELRELIVRSYLTFRHSEIAPVLSAGPVHICELFHGPTLAFKDIALQFLSNLYEHILRGTGGRLNILGATSGDTGSAAIHGARGRERVNIFIMFPKGRVSPLQELQMTTVTDPNVHCLAIEGTFDDGQRIMKSIFSDVPFKERLALGSINSVNWARVLAQIVYYFFSAFTVMRRTNSREVCFAVPTGNFGDILAGWFAAKMGLPVRRLILATNENDILARFFSTGEYIAGKTVPTISPSMDIQVASNFERYLYYLLGEDAGALRDRMGAFSQSRTLSIPTRTGGVDPLFRAGVGTTAQTLETIRRYHHKNSYLLDPHTAVGVHVAEQFLEDDAPAICLATAHPAKFPKAIETALGRDVARHPILDELKDRPARSVTLPANEAAIRDYVEKHAR